MKRKQRKSVTPAKTHKRTAPPEPTWEDVRKMPLTMIHGAGGPPIVGHVGQISTAGMRIYAPAMVTMGGPTSIAMLPVPFVEKYIDLMFAGIRGQNPLPFVVQQCYSKYFGMFIEEAFQMKPLMVPAGIDVPGGVPTVELPKKASEVPAGEEQPAPLETCPSCGKELSNWQAHYPVLVRSTDRPTRESPGEPLSTMPSSDVESIGWVCELIMPEVRETYPNYTPPHPREVTLPSALH